MGAHFEALDDGVLLSPLESRFTQVGFNLISVQVCNVLLRPKFKVKDKKVLLIIRHGILIFLGLRITKDLPYHGTFKMGQGEGAFFPEFSTVIDKNTKCN